VLFRSGADTAVATPTPTACPPWSAIMVPGTGETRPGADPAQPVGLLRGIGDGLQARYGNDIAVRYLSYPAALAPYQASKTAGVQALSATLSGLCESTRIVLAGYSQGADIAGGLATRIGHGHAEIPASQIAAVGLIADPRRDRPPHTWDKKSPGKDSAANAPRTSANSPTASAPSALPVTSTARSSPRPRRHCPRSAKPSPAISTSPSTPP
jgi:hypothetical protein